METQSSNSLGTAPIKSLLIKFAVPSIIAMLVSALYNIVDQFFIGRSIGTLGNAATNIVFPLSTSCVALSLLLGIGSASAFNLVMGAKKKDEAAYYVGNATSLLFISGILLALTRQIIFLLSLILILPKFMGIDGIMYAGPCAYFMAAVIGILLACQELKRMKKSAIT